MSKKNVGFFGAIKNKWNDINKTSEEKESPEEKKAIANVMAILENVPAPERREAAKKFLAEVKLKKLEEERAKWLKQTKTNVKELWSPKARLGDELYPVLRHKSAQKPKTSSKSPISTLSTKSAKTDASSLETSGLEPPPIDDDDETSNNSVRASSLHLLLEDLSKDADRSKFDTKKSKPLQSLSPTELVELCHRDEETWRQLIRRNTLLSIAASSATDDDHKKLKAMSKRGPRVRFNEKVDVILAPVGQPYKANEKTSKEMGKLELEKKRPS